jgi:hypothetical protein
MIYKDISRIKEIKMFNKKEYRENHKEETKVYNKEYRAKNREKNRAYCSKYAKEHRKEANKRNRETMRKVRLGVLNSISNNNPVCVRCGCNDIRLLEVNHKNGDGGKERRERKNYTIYFDVLNNKRRVDDLEILCKICNAWHYLEHKFGKLPYDVKYFK